jgi:hypothetical protein
MAVEGISSEHQRSSGKDLHQYCCIEFLKSRCSSKITEQTSSFTDDKFYCIVDGFGYPILENILYCPHCGTKLVGY